MRGSTEEGCYGPYEALRSRSAKLLLGNLRGYLSRPETATQVREDWRDVLIDLAPFYDCANRLGVDRVDLFHNAAADLPDDVRGLAETFARRADVTLDAFGWTLAIRPGGPCYELARAGDIPAP
jgi:hypothetical protein